MGYLVSQTAVLRPELSDLGLQLLDKGNGLFKLLPERRTTNTAVLPALARSVVGDRALRALGS